MNINILKVTGRSDLLLRIEIIKRCLLVVNVLIAYRWGISAILAGHVVVAGIAYFLNSFYSEKLIAYSMRDQILDVLPSLLLAGLMGGGIWLVGNVLAPAHDFVRLVVQVGVGISIYLAVSWIGKSGPLAEATGLILEWRARQPAKVNR